MSDEDEDNMLEILNQVKADIADRTESGVEGMSHFDLARAIAKERLEEETEGNKHNQLLLLEDLEQEIHSLAKRIFLAETELNDGFVMDAGLTSMLGGVVALARSFAENQDEFDELIEGFSKELHTIADKVPKF
jgi:hypothetical protein